MYFLHFYRVDVPSFPLTAVWLNMNNEPAFPIWETEPNSHTGEGSWVIKAGIFPALFTHLLLDKQGRSCAGGISWTVLMVLTEVRIFQLLGCFVSFIQLNDNFLALWPLEMFAHSQRNSKLPLLWKLLCPAMSFEECALTSCPIRVVL